MQQRQQVDTAERGAAPRPVRKVVVTLAALTALVAAGTAHDSYTVEAGDSLGEIAERHGTSAGVLRGENDITDPDRILVGSTIRIPDGSGATHHVVRAGESLSAIAGRYGVSTSKLVEWNGLRDADSVWSGTRLSVAGPSAPNLGSSGGRTHRVGAGETLSGIADRYGARVGTLARANRIADPNRITSGDTVTIPGGWHCPVRGRVRFVNDYGFRKPSGRFHDGVDLYAARDTPVVAPVAGRVQQARGDRAGLQFRLVGDDGHVYIGTHLDSLGASGRVAAGEVLGSVGTSGNARGTSPHLHFEIHADGERVVNPHPTLRTACG